MRRVIALLDGSELAASILPDARRLAGTGGELILIRDVSERGTLHECEMRIADAEIELRPIVAALASEGIRAGMHVSSYGEPIEAIKDAIKTREPDAAAAVTHARSGLDRLRHGSVSWWLLEHSPVPVLLRHLDGVPIPAAPDAAELRRNILVPLDGSVMSESALPLACSLAEEWDAALYLTQVVPFDALPRMLTLKDQLAGAMLPQSIPMRKAREYLEEIAQHCRGTVHRAAIYGAPVETLAQLAREWWITDIVLASHGRTGFDRVATGSISEDLIKQVHVPVIVVPGVRSRDRISPQKVELVTTRR
jgi:nucleotide-binding universal stress UspA family protein